MVYMAIPLFFIGIYRYTGMNARYPQYKWSINSDKSSDCNSGELTKTRGQLENTKPKSIAIGEYSIVVTYWHTHSKIERSKPRQYSWTPNKLSIRLTTFRYS